MMHPYAPNLFLWMVISLVINSETPIMRDKSQSDERKSERAFMLMTILDMWELSMQ